MSELDRLKEFSKNYSNYNNLFERPTLDSEKINGDIENVLKERKKLQMKEIEKEIQRELLETERYEAQIEELKKNNLILLEAHKQLEKVNNSLEIQVSKLEMAVKTQEEQLDFLKSDSKENSKDVRFSKWVSIISTVIAGVSLWVSIK